MDSEAALVRRCQAGDGAAFAPLLRPYEYALAALVRYRIGHPQHAEDVLQEVLVQAWTRIGALKDPDKIGPWLMQIGRNQCRDHFKAAQRREKPTEGEALARAVDRDSLHRHRRQLQRDEAARVLELVPQPQQQVARLHYLQGLSIAEIAARGRWPQGTVKRHLFQARLHMRRSMEVTDPERRPGMRKRVPGDRRDEQAFPRRRPEIAVRELDGAPFAVECPELRWWLVVPRLGEEAMQATYKAPDWRLDGVARMRTARPAEVEGVEGVQIEVEEWDGDIEGWRDAGWSMCARENGEEIQYLAVLREQEEGISIDTYLGGGFSEAWACMRRRIEETGRFVRQPDGSWNQAHGEGNLDASGAGMCEVRIGDNVFTCLRVLQLEGLVTEEDAPVDEAYITAEGRTVLIRDYVHDCHDDVDVDRSHALVIDGQTRYHWTDRVTGAGLGL